MELFTGTLKTNLESKGKELIEFREKYGLKIKTDDSKDEKDGPTKDRQANILASV